MRQPRERRVSKKGTKCTYFTEKGKSRNKHEQQERKKRRKQGTGKGKRTKSASLFFSFLLLVDCLWLSVRESGHTGRERECGAIQPCMVPKL